MKPLLKITCYLIALIASFFLIVGAMVILPSLGLNSVVAALSISVFGLSSLILSLRVAMFASAKLI